MAALFWMAVAVHAAVSVAVARSLLGVDWFGRRS